MFGIGWSEYLLIGIIALVAIGPKELPAVMRTAGQWIGKIRRLSSEFQAQFQEALREAEMSDVKKHVDDAVRSISKPIDPAEFMDQFETAAKSDPTTPDPTKPTASPAAADSVLAADATVEPANVSEPGAKS
jgi:sec-independent protein translocase protein TatB